VAGDGVRRANRAEHDRGAGGLSERGMHGLLVAADAVRAPAAVDRRKHPPSEELLRQSKTDAVSERG